MKTIKYRQAIYSNGGFANWHYWGFNGDGAFVKPMVGDDCGESYQNTTLRDRNGKEIYEGDILKIDRERKVVEWNNEKAGFAPFVNQIFSAADAYSEWNYTDNGEIIGNIHENPGLLK